MSEFAARIVSTPFILPDETIDVRSYRIDSPQAVEISDNGLWVHVVEHDSIGGRTLLRSYPTHEIQRIEWREDDES